MCVAKLDIFSFLGFVTSSCDFRVIILPYTKVGQVTRFDLKKCSQGKEFRRVIRDLHGSSAVVFTGLVFLKRIVVLKFSYLLSVLVL